MLKRQLEFFFFFHFSILGFNVKITASVAWPRGGGQGAECPSDSEKFEKNCLKSLRKEEKQEEKRKKNGKKKEGRKSGRKQNKNKTGN